MKTTTGLVFALMLASTGAFAQGAPGDRGPGAAGMQGNSPGGPGGNPGPSVQHNPGPNSPGPSMRGQGAGPSVEHRSAPRSAERSRAARQAREERAPNAPAAKPERAQRAEKAQKAEKERTDKKAAERIQDQARTAKDTAKEKTPKSTSEGAASGESGRSAEKKETERPGEKNKEVTTGDHKDAAKRVEGAKRADLSGDKRKQVVGALREKRDVKHRTHVGFDFRVGKRLPRSWVFFPVPVAVVDIVPEYRDYVFVYADDDYLICDPDTYEIVAILPASGGPEYATGDSHTRCTDNIALGEDERDLILRSIEREGRVDVRHLSIGWSVPGDIELLPFPDRVLDRVSELGACRYFVAEDQIAIVSPEEARVVLLIDRS